MSSKKISLGVIFLTVFLDLIGVGIAAPVTAPLLLNPLSGMLNVNWSESQRTIVLGFLIASFPIATFFGGPLLGSLSDRYGRKPILLISLAGTLLGYIIFIIGIVSRHIEILFVARLIDGFTGGNISIIQSAISDVSDAKSRAKNFGLIGMAFGLGFVVGPYIGGKLSDASLVSWFSYETPFYAAALLSVLNIILVVINFRETLHTRSNQKLDPFTGFRNIAEAFTRPQWQLLFSIVFLYALGFNFFTQFFSVYLIKKFQYTSGQIGDFLAFVGFCVALVQGLIVRRTAGKIAAAHILQFTLLGLSLMLYLYVFPNQAWMLFALTPFMAFFQGMSAPNITSIVSLSAPANVQGKVLGMNASFLSLAMAIPPIAASFLDTIDMRLPLLTAGSSVLIAWLLFLQYKKKHVEPQAHQS